MKTGNKLIFFIIFIQIFGFDLYSQIYSPNADFSRGISYNTYTGNDSVFVFYNISEQEVAGSLTAKAPVEGTFNFEWSEYDPETNNYDPAFHTDSNVISSDVNGLEEGGYRVRVYNETGFDTIYLSWVFINDFLVTIEKNAQGQVPTYKISCPSLKLSADINVDSFFYYDPVDHSPIEILNGYTFLWTSDDPDLFIPFATRYHELLTLTRPPVEDTEFYLTATDSFDMQVSDTVFYETIHVKSEYSFQFYDKEETNTFIDVSPPTEDDAPLKVKFINESVNGYSFEWIFEDTVFSDEFVNEQTEFTDYQPEYEYTFPGDYFPILVAESERGCIDTFKIEEPIIVLPSDLKVPNVFTPDGDQYNQYFKVKFESIKEFSIRIYSKSGNLVYKADVNDMYDWEGWDGTIRNSNRPAPNGAYFYVIEAKGYDGVNYRKGPYRGVVYLFRAN